MDFTIKTYRLLLHALMDQGYSFQTFEEFLLKPKSKVIVLRHDVDLLPQNSLRFARIQHENNIKGTYYFRAVPESWNEEIILKIHSLGHEIGYHYETMDTAQMKLSAKRNDKLFSEAGFYENLLEQAYEEFCQHLDDLRQLAPVKTICMHGSPRSIYDNKEIWSKYNYKELGILGEPYLDVDFKEVFYLTDTGRRWDGFKVSVRDKVETGFKHSYHTTNQIINAIEKNKMPNQILFNFHPQRWHEDMFKWMEELVMQSAKNTVKRYFYVNR